MNLLDQIYYYFILPYLLYLILALALLIILVILVIISIKRRKPRLSKPVRKVQTEKKNEKRLDKKQKTLLGWILLILLSAALIVLIYLFWDKIPYVNSLFNQTINSSTNQTLNNTLNQTEQPTNETGESVWDLIKGGLTNLKDFFIDYWLYFAIGLGVLVLLILCIILFRLIKRKGIINKFRQRSLIRKTIRQRIISEKISDDKTPKQSFKIRINKKLLFIILGIILLLIAGYAIYYFFGSEISSLYSNFTQNKNQTINYTIGQQPIANLTLLINTTSENVTEIPEKSSFVSDSFSKIVQFFTDYLKYIMYTIIGLVVLLLLILFFRNLRKRNHVY